MRRFLTLEAAAIAILIMNVIVLVYLAALASGLL
jgi:hypothetical protein